MGCCGLNTGLDKDPQSRFGPPIYFEDQVLCMAWGNNPILLSCKGQAIFPHLLKKTHLHLMFLISFFVNQLFIDLRLFFKSIDTSFFQLYFKGLSVYFYFNTMFLITIANETNLEKVWYFSYSFFLSFDHDSILTVIFVKCPCY